MEMWRRLVAESVLKPRSAARQLFALALPRDVLIQAAAAVTALAILLGFVAVRLSPGGVDSFSATVLASPMLGAAIQFSVILAAAFLTHRIGRIFGGTGSLDGALALVVWLNAMMILVQLIQIGLIVVLPTLAALLAVATVVWVLWAFANFVSELHGFQNPLIVLGGVILTMIVLFFGVAILLALIGVTPPEPA